MIATNSSTIGKPSQLAALVSGILELTAVCPADLDEAMELLDGIEERAAASLQLPDFDDEND